jgi:hypothetical protein
MKNEKLGHASGTDLCIDLFPDFHFSFFFPTFPLSHIDGTFLPASSAALRATTPS